MVGKNNHYLKDTKQGTKVESYSIKKFKVGTASVVIGASIFFGAGAVQAAEEVSNNTTVDNTTNAAEKAEAAPKAEAKPVVETTKENVAAAVAGKVGAEAPKTEATPKAEVAKEETPKAATAKKEILKASIATLEEKLKSAQDADKAAVEAAKEALAAAKAVLANEAATQAEVDAQAQAVQALSQVVTEAKAQAFDKKLEEKKEAEQKAKEATATKEEKEVAAAKKELTQVASEAEVTNTLAKTELSKKDLKVEAKPAVQAAVVKNEEALKLAKELLGNDKATKEQIAKSLAELSNSIKAVYTELENAGAKRNGKFDVVLADATTTALKDSSTETGQKWLEDHGYSSLRDIPILNKGKDDKALSNLGKQIQWLDFSDTAAWTGLKSNGQLQVGSVFTKQLIPGYIVKMTVKELKPFHATEVYKNRVAGTDNADTYDASAPNVFKDGQANGIGGSAQTIWSHIKNAGLDSTPHKTTIAGTDDKANQKVGTIGGVVFTVEATYNGKETKPGIVMTTGEDIGEKESEIYTTNGTPWDLVAMVGKEDEVNPYDPITKSRMDNVTSPNLFSTASAGLQKALANKLFATPDAATAGLGSQVFGGYQDSNGQRTPRATPIVSTAGATEVGMFMISGGAQSSMIGIKLSDFGDLPESYGVAEHFIRTETVNYKTNGVEEIQQPYLGKVKADPEAVNGERVRGKGSDDATDNADEGVDQLIAPDNVVNNKDTGEPEVHLIKGADNTYKVKVIASANGNDRYTGTVEPAYVRGFIDFNGNGKFDKGEESSIAEVTGKNQEVELTFTNTQIIDTSKDVANFRVRIAKDKDQIANPTGIAYSGEVEDNQIQISHPPRGDYEETTGKQGEKQNIGIEFINRVEADASELGSNNGKTTFNAYGKINYTEQRNSISLASTKKVQTEGVMIVDPNGNLVKSYTKAGQGTYEVTDTGITFTPEANFVGKADGIVLRAVDTNGQSTGWTALTDQNKLANVNDGTHTTTTKTMDAVYVPNVTPKEITADPETSTDIQGKEQKKTPTFKTDAGTDTAATVTPSAQYPAKLIDPKTKAEVESVTVDGEGTYTINPTTGEVTFQPLPTFKGTATGVDVTLTAPVGRDKDGRDVTATATTKYTPTVTAVEPTAKPTDSAGVQGETQKGTPTFTAGNAEVPIKENSHKLLDKEGNEVQPGQTTPAYAEDGVTPVGTYSIDPATGEVTFTPTDKTYTGKVTPAKVQAEDKNGTKVNTTYTPHIVGVTPTATPAESSGIQGEVQDGTVTFTQGETTIEGVKKSVPIKANSAKLLNADGTEATGPVDALDPEGNKVGEYTIDPTTNKVTFTPTNKAYKGKVQPANVQAEDENGTKVKTTYTPTIVGVTPTASPAETTDVQGVEQSKEVTFKPGKATINGVEKEVPIDTTSYKLLDENGQPVESVPAKNPAGDVIGTYTLKVIDGKATAVFTPTDKTYAGEVQPVTIQAKDTNGTPVTTTYTPNITPVEPTGKPVTSEGAQGQPQEGTPTFTQGDDKVPMKIDATQPAKLIDPNTGNPTDETTIPAKDANGKEVGTYTIDPTTGKVTFTPNKDFVGTPVPATVQAKDANGTPTTATYTPTVKPVTPVGVNTFTEDIQGAPQSGKPEFKPGKTTIDGKEVEVPMDDKVPATFEDGTTTKTIPGEGTYTVDPDGTVHFTPEPQFKGKGTTMTVVRKDQNGTPVTAEYTAVVHPVTPEGTEVVTAGVQGKEQSGKPNFVGGKVTIDGVEKTVEIDETKPATFEDGTTTKTIPGEGTYTVDPDGTVHFTPEKGFTGKGTELTVKRVDKNGTPALGKYSAVVIGVKPTAEPSVTSDIQGQTQSQPVKFKGGVVEVEDPATKAKTEEVVAIDPNTYTLLDENGQAADKVPAKDPKGNVIGEYTLVKEPGKDPVAVFTPTDKTYSGKVQPVTVQAKDTNGTAVTTTYTPNITPVTPTAKGTTSEGAQGQEQSGTPTFTEGHEKAPIDPTVPAKLIDPETGEPTDEKSVTVPGEGTYTINPETGEVTFKPEPNFTGKAQGVEVQRKDTNGTPATAKYTPTVKPVTPTSDDVVSEDVQGAKQTGTPVFKPGKTTVNGKEVTVEIDETVKPTLEGADEEGKVVVPGEGTYTIDENGVVTFTPEPQFTGKASGVTVKRVDKNGTEVTAKYTPTVKPVTPTADGVTTTDVQGAKQTGKPEFEAGKTTVNGVEKTVELDDTKPATFEDGSTTKEVPGEGTYTVAPDGTVTFTPNKDFTGQASGVTVKRVDKNGTPVTAKYTPVVLPVTPTGKDVTSIGEKGQPQSETPVFTPGTTKVNGKTVTVPIDEKVAPTFEDGTTTKEVPGEGTYTIDKNGKVTFTPEPNFVGTAKGVTVKRVDENGTPVTAKYTPTVLGKTTTENVVSEGAKGQPQSNTPVFKGDVDTTVAPTFTDGTTEKKVPGEGTYTIDKDGKVTFTPEKDFVGTATPVEVVRKDKNGKTIKASYTPTVRPDTKFVVVGKDGKETELLPSKDGKNPSETIPGYKLVKTETDEKGNTKHIYEPVTTKHVDRNGNPIPGTTTEEGTKDPKNIPGYKVVETKKLPNGDTEYVYEKVTTSFVDSQGRTIPGTSTEEGTTPKKDIPGYRFVETKTLENGDTEHVYEPVTTKHLDKNGKPIPGTETEEGTTPAKTSKEVPGYKLVDTKKLPNGDTEYVYEKVTTVFKDKDGNVIPGNPAEEGTTPKKDIPGYRFVETKTLPNGDTEHVYEKVNTVFKDKDGNVIPGTTTEVGEQPKKDIPGYRFVETKTLPNGDIEHVYEKVTTPSVEKPKGLIRDTEGNVIPGFEFDMLSPVLDIPEYQYVETVTDPDGTVRHIYRAKQTIHRDTEGNPIPNVPAKEKGLKGSRNIPGYRLVETKPLPNGDVEYVYEKVTTPTPAAVITTWTDENGNPLRPSENGAKGMGTVEGYEFVRTVVDENGNIRHIFRKVTAATPKAQVKRLANTGSETSNTAAAGFGVLLAGIAAAIRKRKKED